MKSVIVYGAEKVSEKESEKIAEALKAKTIVNKWVPSKGFVDEGHVYFTAYTNPKKVNGGPSLNRPCIHLKDALVKAGLEDKKTAKKDKKAK
jgi:hypothetical protein